MVIETTILNFSLLKTLLSIFPLLFTFTLNLLVLFAHIRRLHFIPILFYLIMLNKPFSQPFFNLIKIFVKKIIRAAIKFNVVSNSLGSPIWTWIYRILFSWLRANVIHIFDGVSSSELQIFSTIHILLWYSLKYYCVIM